MRLSRTTELYCSQWKRTHSKKRTSGLHVMTIILITSTPSSVWVMLRLGADYPTFLSRLLTEVFLTLSYFGNGVAFIALMSISVVSQKKCCKLCFPANVTSEGTRNKTHLAGKGNDSLTITQVIHGYQLQLKRYHLRFGVKRCYILD